MSREDRRYTGGPRHSLDEVRACTGLTQFRVTRKAQYTDGPRVLDGVLDGVLDVFGTIKGLVLALHEGQWRFAQEKDGGWVDVYQVQYEERDIWLKLKLELMEHSKQYAVVVSFHEWDHSRPI
jgi:hypothetical protein